MSRIIDTLERLGDIEWYAIRPGGIGADANQRFDMPPVITFRYRFGNERPYQRLRELISAYGGDVAWVITGENKKNLSLMPERVRQMGLHGKGTLDAMLKMVETDPAFVQLAVQDFNRLLKYLEESI